MFPQNIPGKYILLALLDTDREPPGLRAMKLLAHRHIAREGQLRSDNQVYEIPEAFLWPCPLLRSPRLSEHPLRLS